MSNELALRDAVGAILRATPAVQALVGAKIRDDVPSDEHADKLPWICMGPITTRTLDTGFTPGWAVTLRVLAESNAFNRDQAWMIARAARKALHGAELPLEQGFYAPLSVTQCGDVVAPGEIKTVFVDVTCVVADPDQ